MRIVNLLLFFALILGIASCKQKASDNLIPIDPELRMGTLENGMTYYIRHNQEPKERASFYIIQNVGAVLENDDQNGLAHFLEHMAFNGTKDFPDKGIINTLEKHGVAFGRNINAYTSFDETVYNISDVPVTHDGLVDTCLLVLNNWSNYLLLTEEEIDAERGVISEEWRTRRTSQFRLRNQWFPVLFKGSMYAKRDVIGDLDVIKNFEYQTIRDFYHDWYRTDLQAIAIVGDVNVDEVEAKVKEMFSSIPAVEGARKREVMEIPEHDETRFVLATDKEASQSSISIYSVIKADNKKVKTEKDARNNLTRNLYNSMTRMRISELLQKGNPPFINGSTNISGFLRGYDAYSISTTAKPNEEDKALEAILIETERIKRHGFTEGELERAKTNLLTSLESSWKQKDKIRNDAFIQEYKGHYLEGEYIPGIDWEFEFAKKILPEISLDELKTKTQEWITDKNRTIIVQGPSEGVKHLTEEEAKDIIAKVGAMEIEPYIDEVAANNLIKGKLKGSKVVSVKNLDDLGATEWYLKNNVKVVYKHADFEKDLVLLRAFSFGGSSLVDINQLPSASMLGEFVGSYGIGEFDQVALQKVLTGKKVKLNPQLGELTEGFSGSSTPKDLETLFQLLYLYFENPRFDAEAHSALSSRYQAYLSNMANDPKKIMQDSISEIMSNYHERNQILDANYMASVKVDEIEAIYKDRFQDASDFTFFIVGNADEKTVKSYVEKYIGSITDTKRSEKYVDHKMDAPQGLTEKEIELELTVPKSTVIVSYLNEIEYTPENKLYMNIIKQVLDLRYTENIREKEGGTYGVGVRSQISHYPESEGAISLNFDCDPDRADYLKSLTQIEIDKIIKDGPTQIDLDKAIQNLKKNREQSKLHNSYWLSTLYDYYMHDINFDDPANFEIIIDNITIQDIKNAAKEFFNSCDKVDLIFKPKSVTPAA